MEEGGKGGWRIILGKARKLALASFNIRFILFPATMLGDSLFSRAPLLSLPFSHFCRASRMLIVARNARIEKKSAQFPIFYAIVITRWKFDL